jgi:hypothetical protein
VKKPRDRTRWASVLEKVKAAPGTEPRIMRCETRSQADYHVRSIKRTLERDDPTAWWEFHTAQMGDVRGGYGVWAKYRGQLTQAQIADRNIRRKKHSERMKKVYLKKALRDAQKLEVSVRPFPGAR